MTIFWAFEWMFNLCFSILGIQNIDLVKIVFVSFVSISLVFLRLDVF